MKKIEGETMVWYYFNKEEDAIEAALLDTRPIVSHWGASAGHSEPNAKDNTKDSPATRAGYCVRKT